jgi:rhodanese-related sulfurtransferase
MEQKVPRILKVELKSMLGQPDLVIVDVRLDEEWEKAELKIKGAVRENPERAVKSWAEKYPRDKTIVFYCD